ncbi:hypothetical protein AAHA92_24674 [Salvia divinorum]|uniref:Retrovirus-related Pol polyprotein from transposon TNT 1-94 n=1 Tax=Salvia divinorum TaxID=28513 RepID=A0ABD1GBA6_SALDI
MAATRFEAEKFSRKNDFGLWQIKMKALLIQQGLGDSIQPIKLKEKREWDLDAKEAVKKKDVADRAHNAIILSLTNKLEDEDKAILLLNALPKSTQETAGQALNVNKFKGRKKGKDYNQAKKQKSNTPKGTRSCHYCKKSGHIKNDYFSWKRKEEQDVNDQNATDIAKEIDAVEILNVTDEQVEESWIMNFGCSFHICSHGSWFEDITESTGSVLLGNDQVCSVRGIGSIRLKLHDHAVKLLTDVRFIPNIKRNLISLGALESKGYEFCSKNGCLEVSKSSRIVMKVGYGRLNDYNKFKVFVCRVYAHMKLGKLDPRVVMCVMLGYQEGVKGYRLWCTEKGKQKILISRNVIFNEENMFYLKEQIVSENTNKSSGIELVMQHDSEAMADEDGSHND